MDLPDLRLDFYGTTIDEVRFGPRRELNLSFLDMAGNPHSWVRLGGIVNFDEVREIFAALTFDSLHFLRYSRTETSKPGKLIFEMEFDRWGERCVIRCSKRLSRNDVLVFMVLERDRRP
ncbi:hypothetical protein [Paludisphaera borealis]|uniref:Uncharacterized protein n=1 Tax=Paludisphaera borealis TaxID=1387353 RepID=A0A1U7CTJ6_9BACT|nr:hypothetical protein [Paludisphaera borealis]APW62226.1 hypothetical protein BSF38_03761 [Paludisphaera borealis]